MNKNKNRGRLPTAVALCFLSVFFLFTNIVSAQIEITEIMYNPGKDVNDSKADDGREWIEIYNSGGDINLDGWKLFDDKDGSGHPLSFIIQGDFTIKSQEYLIIADIDIVKDSSTFLTDYPNFSGTVLNSNFGSFNNTVGVLAVDEEDAELLSINWVEYLKEQGAYDNNESLQKINGTWVAFLPTPGEANSQESQSGDVDVQEDPPPEEETQPETSTPTTTSTTVYKIEPQIFAQIIPLVDTPIAGADFFFEAKALGLKGEPLQNETYQWTFGDGARVRGQKVLHNYQYPSDYLVVLEVISGKYSASDRLKIKVIPSDIVISEVGVDFDNNFIELHNPSSYELNLSWWRLRVDNNYFAIPKNTILLSKSRIRLSSRTTNLFPNQNSLVNLLYPNGSVAFNYIKKVVAVKNRVIPVVQNSPIVEKTQVTSQTQVASIQEATQNVSTNNQPVGVLPLLVEDTVLLSTTSLQETQEPESNSSPFNKWTISLAGIVSLAVVGVAFATKLDK